MLYRASCLPDGVEVSLAVLGCLLFALPSEMPGKKRKGSRKAPPSHKEPSLMEKEPSGTPSRRKYRQWTDESMLGAIKAVKQGRMGLNRAALEHSVPKATLSDRLSGRVIHGCKSGRLPFLTPKEEKEMYDWLLVCANIGYPKRMM